MVYHIFGAGAGILSRVLDRAARALRGGRRRRRRRARRRWRRRARRRARVRGAARRRLRGRHTGGGATRVVVVSVVAVVVRAHGTSSTRPSIAPYLTIAFRKTNCRQQQLIRLGTGGLQRRRAPLPSGCRRRTASTSLRRACRPTRPASTRRRSTARARRCAAKVPPCSCAASAQRCCARSRATSACSPGTSRRCVFSEVALVSRLRTAEFSTKSDTCGDREIRTEESRRNTLTSRTLVSK